MRLIDADTFKESVIRWLPQDPCGIAEKERPFETDICVSMLMEIEEASTVDAIEVVRCKNCEHYNELDYRGGWCKYHNRTTYMRCFCSEAERRQT